MNNIDFPYPIGSYVCTKENNIIHIDQVEEYIVNKNGIFVVLLLDVLKNPRLSNKIDIDNFIIKWSLVNKPYTKTYSKDHKDNL